MANIKSARKRARQNVSRNQLKSAQRSQLRTAIKKVRKAVAAGDKAAATSAFQASQSVIDAFAGKRVIHRNTASRYKSRLAAAVRAMG